jgi:hypothetical protein
MRKSLPISVPLSSTYMVPAAEFAVLQSYENGMNYITNRYSQLYLFEDIIKRESMDLGLSLQTDPFDFNPCFHATKIEMQFEYIIKDFIDFIIDSINHGNYVYTYRYIDEYYIKDTASYNQYHVIHMFVIYGYDIERKLFNTMGYNSRNIFSNIEITFDEFTDSIQDIENTGHRYIILVKPNTEYVEKPERDKIKFWIEQYVKSKNSRIMNKGVMDEIAMTDRLVFGHKIYDYMDMYYHFFVTGAVEIWKMDRRSLRQLWEHKKIMMKRIETISEMNLISKDFIKEYKSVLDISSNLQNMQTKINLTEDINILTRIKEKLKSLAEIEIVVLNNILSEI